MKEFFIEIFNYHHHFNQRLAEQVKTNYTLIPEESYILFCHVLNAHQIWNARILSQDSFGIYQKHELEDLKTVDLNNYKTTLSILETGDLERVITYKRSTGEAFQNTVKDILFHVNNHSTHHKAQLATKFRPLGITPMITDFIFYKR